MRCDDAPGDGQAQPDPRTTEPPVRLGTIERLEETREVLGLDTAAAVLHLPMATSLSYPSD